jgi:hypothetical protein
MKRISTILFVLLIGLLIMPGCSKKQSGKDVEMNDNTPFRVNYDLTGKEPGKLDMTIKGQSVKMLITSSKEGQTMTLNMYIKDKILYYIMEAGEMKMAMKSDISKDESFKEFDELINVKNQLKDMEKTGSEEVIGYKCDIYKNKKNELFSIYKERVPLKMTSKDAVMTATSFEPDVKVADDYFDPPKDVEYKDMKDMMDMMK